MTLKFSPTQKRSSSRNHTCYSLKITLIIMAHPLPTRIPTPSGPRAPFKCARSCSRPAVAASWLSPVAPDQRAGTSATPPRITTPPACPDARRDLRNSHRQCPTTQRRPPCHREEQSDVAVSKTTTHVTASETKWSAAVSQPTETATALRASQ